MIRRTPWRRAAAALLAAAAAFTAGPLQANPAPTTAPAPDTCPPLATPDTGPPRDRGLLWRLVRDGRSSFLFGTVHLGRPGWERFGPETRAALAASDVLALEIDPTDPANAAAFGAPGGDPPAAPLPAPVAARLAQALDRACLPGAAMAAWPPVLQVTVLSLTEARWLGLDAAYSQELLLARAVQAAGRPVRALETVAQQRDALVAGAGGVDPALLVDSTLAQVQGGAARRAMARLIEAWQAGDLAVLADYENWCECAPGEEDRALMRRLNDARNPGLADGIEALHAGGQRVFAAVGALHMTGPSALPRLLEARGFKVERVVFSAGPPAPGPGAQ